MGQISELNYLVLSSMTRKTMWLLLTKSGCDTKTMEWGKKKKARTRLPGETNASNILGSKEFCLEKIKPGHTEYVYMCMCTLEGAGDSEHAVT